MEKNNLSDSNFQKFLNKLFGGTPEDPVKIPIKAIQVELTPEAKQFIVATAIGFIVVKSLIDYFIIRK